MSEKKLLYTASNIGHLRTFHRPYLEKLGADGWNIHVAAAGRSMGFKGVSRYFDLPFKKRMLAPTNFLAAMKLSKLMKEHRYDLVIAHTSLAAFFTRLAVKMAGKRDARVINMVHGYLFDDDTPPLQYSVLLAAERFVKSVTDRIITMNRIDTDIARDNMLCLGDVVKTDGMGVDFTKFSPPHSHERYAARKSLGIKDGDFVMVYAAEFSKRKNQAFLIKSLRPLPKRVVLLLPGQGALFEDCKLLAENIGVGDRVIFPGYISDVCRCYHASDVSASSSRSEGLPFNVMEAMACGLPVLATNVKGHEDLIEHDKTGFLFPYGDSKEFRKLVHSMLRMPQEKNEEMGAEAARAVDKYGLKTVMPQVMDAFLSEG